MTASNAHAYCDESGNTGANLLDPNQPLFVVGGWLVLDGYIKAVEQLIKEYIGLLAPRDNELHGVDLLKSKIGTIGILNLTKDLMQGCSPICQIAEKRVLLVGHIFNMFLNPRFNPHVPSTFEDYFEGKHDLMDKVYSLPDELLAEFFEAYSKLDSSILSASLLHIADELSLRMETDLADLMLGSKPNIEAIVEHNITGRRDFDSVTLNTPNAASFHMFFQSLEQIGRAAEIPKITLVHDDTPQFREAFPFLFREFRDDDRKDSFKAGPHSHVYHGFESLKEFRFADSKNEPFLQAADVLASSMNRYALNVYKDIPSQASLTEIARLFLTEPSPYPTVWRTSISDRFADKLYKSVAK